MQRRIDVRLILLAQLILQRNAGKEYLQALCRQRVIDILGQHAVLGALAVVIRLLVADEHIVGAFVSHNRKDVLLEPVNGLGLFTIDALCDSISVLTGLVEIRVVHDGLRTVTGGYLLRRRRVLDILNAILAQAQPPISFGFFRELRRDRGIHRSRLVVFGRHPQSIGTVEKVTLLLIIRSGNCLYAATVFTFTGSCVLFRVQVTAAHFAFENIHYKTSIMIFFSPNGKFTLTFLLIPL